MTFIADESTSRPDATDWLEQALRAEGREHRAQNVPDDGFTARVMRPKSFCRFKALLRIQADAACRANELGVR